VGRLDAEDRGAIDAERGYSVRGEREVKLREWFSLREEGEHSGDFERLVWRLRARKYWKQKKETNPSSHRRILDYRKQWARDNKERYRKAVNEARRRGRKTLHSPGYVRERELKLKRRREERIARHAAAVFTCVVCGAQWCASLLKELPRSNAPKYCMQKCRSRAGYLRAKAAGKR